MKKILKNHSFFAIVLAAGEGRRMENPMPKPYLKIDGKSILEYALSPLLKQALIKKIVIVIHPDHKKYYQSLGLKYKKVKLVYGGETRLDSFLKGLATLQGFAQENDWILDHDGARPNLTEHDLTYLITTLQTDAIGGLLAYPVVDTLKRSNKEQKVTATINRQALWQAATPQMFRYGLLKRAMENLKEKKLSVTDNASAIEYLGYKPKLVKGDRRNIKLTESTDFEMLKPLLSPHRVSSVRIGHGFDVHPFAKNRKLILGGVNIPHKKGLMGHSDADAAIHALGDAMLGALALGDLGKYFPNTDKKYKNLDSRILLKKINKLILERGFSVGNFDLTIVAEAPKLFPYIEDMRKNLAADLNLSEDACSIKATTTEKLGYLGRQEGIAVYAIVLLFKKL